MDEDEEIVAFAGIGSKNYAYQTVNKSTREYGQVTKIRGLALFEEAKEIMSFEQMLKFVCQYQQQEEASISIPQSRLGIDKVTKQLNAKNTFTSYSNVSNKKRFYEPKASLTKLWPYGVTSFEQQEVWGFFPLLRPGFL